jgi:hypothetical protein
VHENCVKEREMTTTVSHEFGSETAYVCFRGQRIMMTEDEMRGLRDVLSATLAGWNNFMPPKTTVEYDRRGRHVSVENR